MKLVATQVFGYAGKNLNPGDPFESVTDEDARILKGVGKAEDAPAEAPPAADGLFESRSNAAEAPERETEPAKGPGRGRYNRRDMRAKD